MNWVIKEHWNDFNSLGFSLDVLKVIEKNYTNFFVVLFLFEFTRIEHCVASCIFLRISDVFPQQISINFHYRHALHSKLQLFLSIANIFYCLLCCFSALMYAITMVKSLDTRDRYWRVQWFKAIEEKVSYQVVNWHMILIAKRLARSRWIAF